MATAALLTRVQDIQRRLEQKRRMREAEAKLQAVRPTLAVPGPARASTSKRSNTRQSIQLVREAPATVHSVALPRASKSGAEAVLGPEDVTAAAAHRASQSQARPSVSANAVTAALLERYVQLRQGVAELETQDLESRVESIRAVRDGIQQALRCTHARHGASR